MCWNIFNVMCQCHLTLYVIATTIECVRWLWVGDDIHIVWYVMVSPDLTWPCHWIFITLCTTAEFTINNMHTAKWERQNKENTEQQCRRNKDKEHLYIEQWAPLRVRSISESEGEMRKRLEFFSESGLTWICRRPELFRRKLQFGEHEWLTKFATPASFVLGKRKSFN